MQSAAIQWHAYIAQLSQHFRLVMPDLGTQGANSRFIDEGLTMPSTPEEAQEFILDWWTNWVKAMGAALPSKFCIAGIGNGGYQAGLFASKCPERVEKLLMLAPQVVCPTEALAGPGDVLEDAYLHIFKDKLEIPHQQLVSSLKYELQ